MNKILYWLSPRPIFALIAKGYQALMKILEGVPGFPAYRRRAGLIAERVFGFVRFPKGFEETVEPFLEIERGRKMDPVIVVPVLAFMAALGMYPSSLGHLDTAPVIWKALPIVSGFNPYLGLVSGIVFSVFDWLAKVFPIFGEAVYGATLDSGVQNWIGARIGYIFAYSTMILNGLLPGVMARVFRWVLGDFLKKILPRPAIAGTAAVLILASAVVGLGYVGGSQAFATLGLLLAIGMVTSGGNRWPLEQQYPGGHGSGGPYPGGGQGQPGTTCQCGQALFPGAWQCMYCHAKTPFAEEQLQREQAASERATRKQAEAEAAAQQQQSAAASEQQHADYSQGTAQQAESAQAASTQAQAQKAAAEQAAAASRQAEQATLKHAAAARTTADQASAEYASAAQAAQDQSVAAEAAGARAQNLDRAAAEVQAELGAAGGTPSEEMLTAARRIEAEAQTARVQADQAVQAHQAAAEVAASRAAEAQRAATAAAAEQAAATQAAAATEAATEAVSNQERIAQAAGEQAAASAQTAHDAQTVYEQARSSAAQHAQHAETMAGRAAAAQADAQVATQARASAEQAAAAYAAHQADVLDQQQISGGKPCTKCGQMVFAGAWQCGSCGANTPEADAFLKKKEAAEAAAQQAEHAAQIADPWGDALGTFAAIVGATTGIVASHEWAQRVGNYTAFIALRADPDVSCRALSEGNYSHLQQQAPLLGAAAGLAPPGAAGAVSQMPGTPPPSAPGMPPQPLPAPAPEAPLVYPAQPGTKEGDSAYREVVNDNGSTSLVPMIYDSAVGGYRDSVPGEVDSAGQTYVDGSWQNAASADFQARSDAKAAADQEAWREKTKNREWDYQKDLDAKAAQITEAQQQRAAREAENLRQQQYREGIEQKWDEAGGRDAYQQQLLDAQVATQGLQGVKNMDWAGMGKGMVKDSAAMTVGMVKDVASIPGKVYGEMTWENAEIALRTVGYTAGDLLLHPFDSTTGAAGRIWDGSAKIANHMADHVKEHGILQSSADFTKVMLGVDNWEKAFDPNTPPNERGWRALFGAVDAGLNIGSGGIASAEKAGLKILDKVHDLAGITRVADKVGDVQRTFGKLTGSADEAARLVGMEEQAFARAQTSARTKIDDLAGALKSGDPDRIRDASIAVQTDKNALYTLNKDKGRFQNEIIGLNRDQTALSNAVDNKVIAELSQDGQLYRVKQTTNPKTGLQSAPHDLDKTFERAVLDRNGNRVWEDVPRDRPIHPTSDKTLKDLYGQKLDEVAQSRTTHPGQEGFRKAIDHEITDGRFAESYGFKAVDHRVAEVLDGSQDLDRLLNRVQVGTDAAGKPMYGTLDRTAEVLTDAEGVGRTISYKAEHWYGRADEARQAAVREMNAGNTVAAERHLAEASTRSVEGMRQTTKQLGNQLTPRWEAARNAVAEKLPVGRNIDEVMPLSRMNKLQEAADIMELGHKGGWPPSRVDELLQQQVGMSSRQVSEQVGQMVEALDTLRPVQGNIGATAPWGGLKVPPGTGAGLRTGIEGVAGSEPGSFFDLFGGEAS